MKRFMLIALAMSFAVSLAVAKDCPAVKGNDKKDTMKLETIEGKVLKIEEQKGEGSEPARTVATIKTSQGEEKVLLCPMKGGKNGIQVGDQVSLEGCRGSCKMGGKDSKMFCAMGGTCNGKKMKMDKSACPMMKGKKDKKECCSKKEKKAKKGKDATE